MLTINGPRVTTAFMAVALWLGWVVGVQAQTTLTGSTWVPPTHTLTRALVEWGTQLEKESGSRLKLNVLPKPVTSPPGHFDAVRDSLVDVSYAVQGYTPGRFPLATLAELPFLGDSAEALSVAFQRIATKYPQILDEYKGIKVLAVFTHGPGTIYNTKRPITSLSDLQGLKFRVGGGMVNEIAKAIGANVTLKPAPESYELISSGVMDGVFFPAESIQAFKLEKLIKHVTVFPGGLYNTAFVFMMNKATYDRLSPQDKAAIDNVSGEHLARLLGRGWDAVDREGQAVMQANGIVMTPASAAFVKEISDRVVQFEQSWINAAKQKGIREPEAVIEEFRADIKRP
jgi:TRAP-type transport system periplasmic protein